MATHAHEGLAQTLVTQAQRRLELIGVELAEEEVRLTRLLFWELIAVFLSCVGVVLLLLFAIAAWWDTPFRLQAVGWSAAVVIAAAAVGWSMFRAQQRRMPPLFRETLAELRKDAQALER